MILQLQKLKIKKDVYRPNSIKHLLNKKNHIIFKSFIKKYIYIREDRPHSTQFEKTERYLSTRSQHSLSTQPERSSLGGR